jgi:AraC-like DNA-binding protein
MTSGRRLHEPATMATGRLNPLWHVDEEQAFFAGPLDHNTIHQHSVPVYLAGLYGSFGLRIAGAEWLNCRAAVISAGVAYEFDVGGDPLAVLYIEPNVAPGEALTPLVHNTREVTGALVGSAGEISVMRELYEDRSSSQWAGQALKDLVAFSKQRSARELDPRVSFAIEFMQGHNDDLVPVTEVADSVGLSASRFQHLFSQQIGVPFRRYRGWRRLRVAILEISNGSNFTTAAHVAGFFDQAHFAHVFRRTFGAPPSRSLLRVRTWARAIAE